MKNQNKNQNNNNITPKKLQYKELNFEEQNRIMLDVTLGQMSRKIDISKETLEEYEIKMYDINNKLSSIEQNQQEILNILKNKK